jgi:23S rRNA A1618 N6-methylase RlmF
MAFSGAGSSSSPLSSRRIVETARIMKEVYAYLWNGSGAADPIPVRAAYVRERLAAILASNDPVLIENSAIAVDLVFHAGCWYSLMSPASLGRSWIRSVRTGKGSTSGSSFGARKAMP